MRSMTEKEFKRACKLALKAGGSFPAIGTPNQSPDTKQKNPKKKGGKKPGKISEADLGSRVSVAEYASEGTLRFVGQHAESGKLRCGVELDDPVGKNNGTVKKKGAVYFVCADGHGVLTKPDKVTIIGPPAELPLSGDQGDGNLSNANNHRALKDAGPAAPDEDAGENEYLQIVAGLQRVAFAASGDGAVADAGRLANSNNGLGVGAGAGAGVGAGRLLRPDNVTYVIFTVFGV